MKIAIQLALALLFIPLFGIANQAPVQNLRLLQQGPSPSRLSFGWDFPSSGNADHYQIYMNGDFQATITGTIWADENLLPNRDYTLTVRAVSASGEVSEAASITAQSLPIPSLASSYKWNTVLVRYADFPDEPFSSSAVDSWIYSESESVNAYFSEVSYGRTSITGSVFGWYTLPHPASHYHTRGERDGLWWEPDLGKILADLDPIAPAETEEGVDGRLLVLHGTGDAGYAAGSVKIISSRLGQSIIDAVIHELGHSFSSTTAHLGHPGGWLCPTSYVGPSLLNPQSGGCKAYTYGYEPFDPMGSGTRHFMAYHKWLLGMIDEDQIVVADEGVVYDLTALAVADGVKMIRIPIDSEYFYCLEYRKPIGLDGADLFPGSNFNPDKTLIDGVLVRIRMMGPGTFPTLLAYPPGQRGAPFICNPGVPFEDPFRGIRIEVVSKPEGEDIARVKFVRTPHVAPQMSSIQHDTSSNIFSFSWQAEAGATYLIERSFDLKEWITLNQGYPYAPYPEDGATGNLESFEEAGSFPKSFYRVKRR